MGTWSCESFGNDSACDWAYDLEEGPRDFSFVEETLRRAADQDPSDLDADAAVEAIAAAETIAKALGRGTRTDAYTERVDQWVAALTVRPDESLIATARQALERIVAPGSELRELWEESDEFEEWLGIVGRLRSALET